MRLFIQYLMISLLMVITNYEYESDVRMINYGVLDRITENGQAHILIESLAEEIKIDHALLPLGSHVHTWFQITQNEKGSYQLLIDHRKTWHEWRRSVYFQYVLRQKNQHN